jgi:hypothetical protein
MRLLGTLVLLLACTACVKREHQKIARYRQVYQKHPIAVSVYGKYIDEDTPIDYVVRFRNAGRQIVSFDYTVADQRNVPHVDRDGPNSGFVANLYPGATIEVANPLKRKQVYVTMGTATYGKKTAGELDAIYRTDALLAAEQAPVTLAQ